MWRHYVYLHRRATDDSVFYVGKGSLRSRQKKQNCERAHTKDRRNPVWHNIVQKHGLRVEIFASCFSDGDAQELEMALIAHYGRRNLCNLTDGGDGHAGIECGEALREKRRIAASKPRSAAWVASIRKARANGGNGGVVKKGDCLPAAWRDAIAAGQRGPNNYMRGRTGEKHPRARRVVCEATGAVYASVGEAATALGLKMQTLHNHLSGHRTNRTTLRFG